MTKKAIGILGGLGPETTSQFYLELLRRATVSARPAVCIWSLPLNLRKESEYIRDGRHAEYYFSLLRKGAQALVNAGTSKLVIPCNTVHEFHPRLATSIRVPVTNLIQVVAEEVSKRNWSEVFLMATSRTIKTRLYQNALQRFGVRIATPSRADQLRLDALIQGLLGEQHSVDHQKFLERLVAESQTRHIVLGCTDLQLLFPSSENVIDSMQTLVEYTASTITS